jgi:gas vesicle protein
METKTNDSSVWPYVVLGSAVGGALGYLFVTESGRKFRRSLTDPDEMSNNMEGVRSFVQRKTQVVTDQVHGALNKAKYAIEEGQLAYHEAEHHYQSRFRQIQSKNNQIAGNVHKAVDNLNRTALTVEQSVMDPMSELAALYRGLERGIRAVFGGGSRSTQEPRRNEGPVPVYRDTRIVGD